eukprot:175202_1
MSLIVRDRDHIRAWIQTNRLMNNINDNILKQCLPSILELFNTNNNIKWLLQLLTKNANLEQIQSMNKIISQQKRKFDEENKNNLHHDQSTDIEMKDNINTSNNNNTISLLPNECISHICGYLDKNNIKSFKLTSRQNSIVCLQEMDKISIGVYNTNCLITNNNKNPLDLSLSKITYNLKYSRHPKNKRFHSLYNEWHNMYDIPPQNQLLFTPQLILIDTQSIQLTSVNMKDVFVLFDTRNIIILNKDSVRLFDTTHDTFKNLNKHYKLLAVQYFDVITHNFIFVNIIMYKHENVTYHTLLQYIQRMFIATQINNKWYDNLQINLKKMSVNKKHQKLGILRWSGFRGVGGYDVSCLPMDPYFRTNKHYLEEKISIKAHENKNIVTVSLNPFHSSFRSLHTHVHKTLKEKLQSMGFSMDYIVRACCVYERNYGFNFKLEVVIEIIVRLKNKDAAKKNKKEKKATTASVGELK